MAEQNKPVPDLDAELNTWLDTADDETREVIVEARVPKRRVRLDPGTRPKELTTDDGPSRAAVLQELQEFLTGVLGSAPRILSAAGAIPLRATQDQLRRIVRHPLVKAVRANRRLK
jgi:hypothetical protein